MLASPDQAGIDSEGCDFSDIIAWCQTLSFWKFKMITFRTLLFCVTMFVLLALSLTVVANQQGSDSKKKGRAGDKFQEVEDPGPESIVTFGFVDDGNAPGGAGGAIKGANGVGKASGVGKKSVTDLNGKRTVSFEKSGARLAVVVKRRYSPEDYGSLIERHPELADYIEMFPKKINGSEIEMSFSITTKYEARNLEELKEKHPTAFSLHRRYFHKIQGAQGKK